MTDAIRSRRIWGFGLAVVLGAATLAYAQFGGGTTPVTPVSQAMEYTQQEVQSGGLVEALNALGKQKWDVFQVVPLWKFENNNGEAELTPQRYQILARRPLGMIK
jgi:hypothetical protein